MEVEHNWQVRGEVSTKVLLGHKADSTGGPYNSSINSLDQIGYINSDDNLFLRIPNKWMAQLVIHVTWVQTSKI